MNRTWPPGLLLYSLFGVGSLVGVGIWRREVGWLLVAANLALLWSGEWWFDRRARLSAQEPLVGGGVNRSWRGPGRLVCSLFVLASMFGLWVWLREVWLLAMAVLVVGSWWGDWWFDRRDRRRAEQPAG